MEQQPQQSEQQIQQQFVTFTDDLPPPVVGVPVGSSTSIHTTVAGSGHVGDVSQQQQQTAPAPTLADIIAAAAAEAASIQQPTLPSQSNNTESMNVVQVE